MVTVKDKEVHRSETIIPNGHGKSNRLLQPAVNGTAALKMGIFGEAGSGKSYTAANMAIGLSQYLKSKKPVGFFDTEKGSDFLIPKFQAAGITLLTVKSQAFSDLLTVTKEAETSCAVLIVDSITHVWRDLMKSYLLKMGKKKLVLKDWMPIKEMWRDFSELYVNSPLHIIICGRAKDVWKQVLDEEGASELRAVDQKMQAEGEFGYEADMLVKMEIAHQQGRSTHKAIIWKGRVEALDGKEIENPTFEDFLPHVAFLNLKGTHEGSHPERTSEAMIEKEDTGYQRQQKKDILLETIENEIMLRFPGRSDDEKVRRVNILSVVFGTKSWKAVCTLPVERLEAGVKLIPTVAVAGVQS